MDIKIKTKQEINIMRRNCQALARIMEKLEQIAKPGIATIQLEKLAQKLISKFGASPSFQGFNNYPAALCASINDEVVHALPRKDKVIREGDIVSLDLGLHKDGFHSDMATTLSFPPLNQKTQQLLKTTRQALDQAIAEVRPEVKLGKISNIIQKTIEQDGFYVIKELTGHGIGKELHEDPNILNYGPVDQGPFLKPGMVLAIEPMASIGSERVKKGPDGFAYVTKDNSLSAHFEHTLVINEGSCEVLTKLK